MFMKKIVFIILLSVFLPLSNFALADWNWGTGFEDYNLGELNGQQGWTADNIFSITNDLARHGSQSLEVSSGIDKTASLSIPEFTQGEVDFYFRAASSNFYFYVLLTSTTGDSALDITFYGNSIYIDGQPLLGAENLPVTFNNETWNNIEIDWGSQKNEVVTRFNGNTTNNTSNGYKGITGNNLVISTYNTLFFMDDILLSHKFASGSIDCTVKLSICGNGSKESGEDCDNGDLGGQTCQSRGFSGGSLSCNIDCTLNTSGCTSGGGGGISGGGGPINPPQIQRADVNNDNKVDISDFNILMVNWGAAGSNSADFNSDGIVDLFDFNLLMINWTI